MSMHTQFSVSESGFERHAVEDIALQVCPLCAWPIIDAVNFCKPGATSPSFAKVGCMRCGCRITGASVKDLTERWNTRPIGNDASVPF